MPRPRKKQPAPKKVTAVPTIRKKKAEEIVDEEEEDYEDLYNETLEHEMLRFADQKKVTHIGLTAPHQGPQVSEAQLLAKGVFAMGGLGTYVIVGPTKAGKNWFIEQHLRKSAEWVNPEHFLIFSTTGKINSDWDYLEEFEDSTIHYYDSFKVIPEILDTLTSSLLRFKEAGGDPVRWLKAHRTVFIVNDFFGMGSLSTPSNPFNTLASKIRHLGGILIVFTQHSASLNPGIYTNSTAVITFDASTRVAKHMDESMPVDLDVKRIVAHNSLTFQHVVFLFGPFTGSAVYCRPLSQNPSCVGPYRHSVE